MFQTRSLLLVGTGFLLGALFMGAQQDPRKAAIDAMMRADREFDKATAARGIEGWLAYCNGESRMFNATGMVQGREAIRGLMGAIFANPKNSLRWQPDAAEASAAGDFGYTTGTSVRRIYDAEGKLTEGYGRYVTVWRKQPDGSWKIALDLGSPRQKPPQP